MTKKKLTEFLSQMDAPELQELIVMLSQRSKESKKILEVYFNQVDVEEVFQEKDKKMEKCFRHNGKPRMADPKLKDARAQINEFKRLLPQAKRKLLELKLKYCFYLAEFLSESGGGEISWENSLMKMFDEACTTIIEEGWQEYYTAELKHIVHELNRNYAELLDDYLEEYLKTV
jgi:hypothetical protein